MKIFQKLIPNIFSKVRKYSRNSYPASGIYALYLHDEIVYIGQSLNVFTRVDKHINEGVKDFDYFKVFLCHKYKLDKFEKELIRQHKPHYNIAHNPKPKAKPVAVKEKKVRVEVSPEKREEILQRRRARKKAKKEALQANTKQKKAEALQAKKNKIASIKKGITEEPKKRILLSS